MCTQWIQNEITALLKVIYLLIYNKNSIGSSNHCCTYITWKFNVQVKVGIRTTVTNDPGVINDTTFVTIIIHLYKRHCRIYFVCVNYLRVGAGGAGGYLGQRRIFPQTYSGDVFKVK